MTITKLKILNDKNVKQVLSHLIFLTQFVCGVIITPDIDTIYGSMDRPLPKTCDNHR